MTPNERLRRAWTAEGRDGVTRDGLSMGGVVVQVDSDGVVWVRNEDGKEYAWAHDSRRGLPALDSSANCGHWLSEYERITKHPARLLVDLKMDTTLPSLLMRILCVRANRGQITVPPECLAWYELEGV